MRRLRFVFLLLFFLCTPLFAGAESIPSFASEVTLKQDSSYTVQETIRYDFGSTSRHGIYRTIPYAYKRNNTNYNVRITLDSVKDKEGKEIPAKTTVEAGKYQFRIGDPDVTITGQQTYVITYTVTRGINYFPEQDELFWNVSGSEWDPPVQKQNVETTVSFPGGVVPNTLKTACYTGIFGSTTSDCVISSTDKTLTVKANKPLPSSEDLTYVIGIPKGILTPPSMQDEIIWFFQDNIFILLAILAPFLTFGLFFYLWWTRGKDPEGRGTIMPEFSPPKDMLPAEVGTLLDEKADMKDISATIIDLCVKGFIKLREIEKKGLFGSSDYELIKLKEASELTAHETQLMGDLFGSRSSVTMSSLKDQFYTKVSGLQNGLYDSLVGKGFFPENPNSTKMKYIFLSIVLGGLVAGLGVLTSEFLVISGVVSGVIGILFSLVMARKTKESVIMVESILGFKEYLSMAEKDMINFLNAPEKKPETFERYLPYAMVLGVEGAWAKQFEDIYKQPPDWYEGNWTTFNTMYMIHSLNSFSTRANSVLVSAPSSTAGSGGSGFGGGGFSGGGFGGGGGGSW